MAGRNLMPHHADSFRGFREVPLPVLNQSPGPMSIPPAALEEELEIQQREMLQIISDNRLVIDENTHLQRELTAVKDDVHRLGQIIPKLHADKRAQARELTDRGLKLEAELHAAEHLNLIFNLKAEAGHLRAEVQKLNALRQELTTQVKAVTQDLNRLQTENKQLIAMRADINVIRTEIVETRRAFEFERKANEELVEQKQIGELLPWLVRSRNYEQNS